MKPEENIITIDGQQVFYWQKNPDQKKVVVLLHGFPGNHMGLVDMARHFGGAYRIIIPDLPASGKSESLRQKHVLKNYAKWLNAFLEKLGIAHCVIVGHSFGARVALMFSVYYPSRVEKLVLLTPVVRLDGLIPRIASLKGQIAKLLPMNMRKTWLSHRLQEYAVAVIVFKSATPKKRREIINRDIEELKHLDSNAHIELFDEFYKIDLAPFGRKVAVPTLVVAGDKDSVATLKSVKELTEQIGPVSFSVMEDEGHLLPLERPLATAKIIVTWLDSPNNI